MKIKFTPKGTAYALIAGLKAMCGDNDEAKDEAERLAQMFSEMAFSLVFEEDGEEKKDRRADYLDGIAEVLEEFAVSKEDDGHGPNQEWPPGAPVYR